MKSYMRQSVRTNGKTVFNVALLATTNATPKKPWFYALQFVQGLYPSATLSICVMATLVTQALSKIDYALFLH